MESMCKYQASARYSACDSQPFVLNLCMVFHFFSKNHLWDSVSCIFLTSYVKLLTDGLNLKFNPAQNRNRFIWIYVPNIDMARLYKNMEIFQLSYSLCLDIHRMLDKFPEKEKDNIISQMRRAATSVPLNIAEGSVKKSQKEFLNFLGYSYGSAKELDVLLSMSKDLNYISVKDYETLFGKLDMLMAKLFGFMKNIEGRFENKKRFFTKYKGDGKDDLTRN